MREVTILLAAPRVILPAFTVPLPWWQEVESVVSEARSRLGVEIVILRVAAGETVHRSPVTYLAEATGSVPRGAVPWLQPDPPESPLRMPWARPGGPQADLAWARSKVVVSGKPVQVRSWNLSSIWRLPSPAGTAWLKHVPPFFSHEGAVIEWLGEAGHPVPRLVARDGARMLLADVPGVDGYDAPLDQQKLMVDRLVAIQATAAPHHLLDLGAPDWRARAFQDALGPWVLRDCPPGSEQRVESLLQTLPRRFAALDDCGLPSTLVHGDFHRGNTRLTREGPVLLDWGDCGVGHPLLDLSAFVAGNPWADAIRSYWLEAWKRVFPGSDPSRAARLVAPIAALRQALIYRTFLDRIEETERVYHRDDPARWLQRAAESCGPDSEL